MAARDLGVVGKHKHRLANDPEYREAALTAPSITLKTGISAKVLPRTTPTALSADAGREQETGGAGFDVDSATKDELLEHAEQHGIDVKKSGRVDEIRDQVKAAG